MGTVINRDDLLVCDLCLKKMIRDNAILTSIQNPLGSSVWCEYCFDKHICNPMTNIQNVKEFWFCDDNPDGSLLVQCQMCGCDFSTKSKLPNYKEQCPMCGEILDYPEGASW